MIALDPNMTSECLSQVACCLFLAQFKHLTNIMYSEALSHKVNRECSGSVVECLTRDRRVAGSSLTGVTALWSLSKTHLS